MWLCPAQELVAGVLSWVELRDLRVLVLACVSVSCGAGWQLRLESGTAGAAGAVLGAASRAELGSGTSCASTVPNRSSGTPWQPGLWDFQRENPARIGLRVHHFGVFFGVSHLAFGGGPGEVLGEMGISWLSGVSLSLRNESPPLKNSKYYTRIIPVAGKFFPVRATTFGVNTGLIQFSFMLYWHLILCQDRIPNALKAL